LNENRYRKGIADEIKTMKVPLQIGLLSWDANLTLKHFLTKLINLIEPINYLMKRDREMNSERTIARMDPFIGVWGLCEWSVLRLEFC
jgi:hypothetical protein